jgi:glutathione-regulated potassium-efflux system ancillary protein KefF
MILVVLAHPYPDRSRANRVLTRAIADIDRVAIRSLYDLYPDFAIDAEAEKSALAACSTVVWQHPLYWYTAPALLKLWFEKVLTAGWAYGPNGDALRGKRCLWVVSTGADTHGYSAQGLHQHTFDAFVPVMRQTAQFCGMTWLEPIVVHGAHKVSDTELLAFGARYREQLLALQRAEGHNHA